MAIYKFILKPGKGVRTITPDDLELIEKDFTEDIQLQRTFLQNISDEFRGKIDQNRVITSNQRQITYNSNIAKNDDTYLLTYNTDNQNIEFIASSGFPGLGTVRRLVVKLETENAVEFRGQFASQIVIAPKGKVPMSSGRGNVIEVYLVRTQDSRNLMFLTGDLDSENTGTGSSTGLEAIDQSNGIGWRLKGRNPANYGNIGYNAIDFSEGRFNGDGGATGYHSFALGENTKASAEYSFSFGDGSEATGDSSFAGGSNAKANESNAFSFGRSTQANGRNSIAMGDGSNASGVNSVALGSGNAIDNNTFAFGGSAFGNRSIAINGNTNGENSISILGVSLLTRSTAIGFGAYAAAQEAVVLGNSRADSFREFAVGSYPVILGASVGSQTEWIPSDRLFTIGNGTDGLNRSNACVILKNGTITAPSLTNPLIDTAGPKALITKEYADANYGNGGTSGFGKLETFEITLTNGDLLFGDTKPLTELIPARLNHVIVINRIAILGNITKGVEQSYANVFIAYNKPGYNFELIEVKTDAGKQLQTNSTDWDLDNNLLDIAQSPVSAAVVLKGPDGVGTSGLEGTVNVKIEYSYMDVTSIV